MPKASTTWIGHKWELYAHKYILPDSILVTIRNRNAPHDIEFNGFRINVKAAKLKKMGRGCLYYDFKLKSHAETCDFFLLIGYKNKRDINPLKIWIIPSDEWTKKELVIGINHKGRWKSFEIPVPERQDKRKKAA